MITIRAKQKTTEEDEAVIADWKQRKNKTTWSGEETRLLIALYRQNGGKTGATWSKFKELVGKTQQQVRDKIGKLKKGGKI